MPRSVQSLSRAELEDVVETVQAVLYGVEGEDGGVLQLDADRSFEVDDLDRIARVLARAGLVPERKED